MDHGYEKDALEILSDLHGKGNSENELVRLEYEEIQQQIIFEKTEGAKRWMDMMKPGVLWRVSIGAGLHMWTQVS